MPGKKDISWRIAVIYFGLLIFAALIIYRLIIIQVYEAPELKKEAKKQEIREHKLVAAKGSIFSDKGQLLATSIPVFDIRMDVANINVSDALFKDKVDSLALQLGKLFGKPKRYYKHKLIKARRSGNRYLLLANDVSYKELKKLRTFPILRKGKMQGGLIEKRKIKRTNPFGSLAARTIGYKNNNGGKVYVGIEGAYADKLNGKDGKELQRRINHGDWIPVIDDNDKEPQDGYDIVTTINVNFQDIAEEALRKQLILHNATMGCAVVMAVKTGDIKAIANLNKDHNGTYRENYNMAINKKIEPGSTFKLASLMAAIEDKKLTLRDTVDASKGYVVFYGRTLRDVHPVGNGPITVTEVFEHSSNVGVSKLIWRLYHKHPAQFVNRLYTMRLNKPLGIEIKGEQKPKIKHPKYNKNEWYGTSLPWMSVGYEVELTPLQLLTFYNSVANNGIMVKPRFVTEIKDGGIVVQKFDTIVLKQHVVSHRTILAAQKLLLAVVENGTGKILKNNHFKIAGKTGTAKISGKNGYINGAYNATFVGYFPADNPQYSCIVVINKPTQHGYYGASAAAPAFKEIADKIYATSLAIASNDNTLLNGKTDIPIPKKMCYAQNAKTIYKALGLKISDYIKNEEWVTIKKHHNTINLNAVEPSTNKMPDVRGMKAKDAIYLLTNLGLKTLIKGRGVVRSQSVKPGANIKGIKKIILQLSIL